LKKWEQRQFKVKLIFLEKTNKYLLGYISYENY
jgi:hypothetical protein